MKKLRMIVTSVVVLAIAGSAFAFNAKKIARYCYSSVFNGACVVSPESPLLNKVAVGTTGSAKRYYVTCWDSNNGCTTGSGCNEPAGFLNN